MDNYLAGLSSRHRELLTRINQSGLDLLRGKLTTGNAVAFLGDGASAPLYPVWREICNDLLERAAELLPIEQEIALREQAQNNLEEMIETAKTVLGYPAYKQALRELFGTRRDSVTGRPFTPVQEFVARCNFKGVISTSFDQGIVNARMTVRPKASVTGFSSWADEDAMDAWRSGSVFTQGELPILYAHGHHNQPDALILTSSDYQKAYQSGLDRVLRSILENDCVVWVGFNLIDRGISRILQAIEVTASSFSGGWGHAKHVAILPWVQPDDGSNSVVTDPETLARQVGEQYGCQAVLYPVWNDDPGALSSLLADLVDAHFPAADKALANKVKHETLTTSQQIGRTSNAERQQLWVHGGAPPPAFIGRTAELKQFDRWAEDPDVRVIGVTAWGGAGKTSLVRHWIQALDGTNRRPDLRGVFAWSFYDDNSVENWAAGLLRWAREELRVQPRGGLLEDQVLDLLAKVPILLVLDGLEVGQDAATQGFGRFLDGTLRTVLTLVGQLEHMGLLFLTSRFPFADLEPSIGGSTRILEVPSLTEEEGAELLRTSGVAWLPVDEQTSLVRAVDGHALALGVLAAALAERPANEDLQRLRIELAQATRTNTRVTRVLHFYAVRLDEPDRRLIAVVSLFQRPVDVQTISSVAALAAPDSALAKWTTAEIIDAIRGRLPGLLEWNHDGSVTAHPLVREAFRPLALTGATAQYTSDVVLADLPRGPVRTLDDARLVVEMIELLLAGGQWQAADDLYRTRSNNGSVWRDLPAAPLGLRASAAFVFPIERRQSLRKGLGGSRVTYYLNTAGVFAAYSGDLPLAEPCLIDAAEEVWSASKSGQLLASDIEVRLSILSRSRADLAAATGDLPKARELANEAVTLAARSGDRGQSVFAQTSYATVEHRTGSIQAAEQLVTMLPTLQRRIVESSSSYVDVLTATMLAGFLIDTERIFTARRVLHVCLDACERQGWNADIARCKALLGRSSLALMDVNEARALLTFAADSCAAADHVISLAATLVDLAESHRRSGDLAEAERVLFRAISLAAPRGLVPSQSRALAVRAALHGDLVIAKNLTDFSRARDYANSALTLATRTRQLPWCELAALQAHEYLDRLEGKSSIWAARVAGLRHKIIPPGLGEMSS